MILTRFISQKILLIGLAFSIAAAGLFGLERSGALKSASIWLLDQSRDAGLVLDQLRIEGAERTKRYDILSVLEVDGGMPLLAVELEEIRERLESLPWVRRAAVARRFPNELAIIIEERQPFALWQKNGILQLVDTEGQIVKGVGLTEFESLRILVGDGAPEASMELAALSAIDPDLMALVRSVIRVGNRRWDLLFTNGIRVKLPDNATDWDSESAFARFSELEANDRLLDREVSVIDMRFDDRIVLRVLPAGRRAMDGLEERT